MPVLEPREVVALLERIGAASEAKANVPEPAFMSGLDGSWKLSPTVNG